MRMSHSVMIALQPATNVMALYSVEVYPQEAI